MEPTNLTDTLFWFSFSVMLDHKESISIVKNRIKEGIINTDKLQEELTQLISDNKFNWIDFVINNDIISKFQAEEIGNLKCKDYVLAILNNFITLDKCEEE